MGPFARPSLEDEADQQSLPDSDDDDDDSSSTRRDSSVATSYTPPARPAGIYYLRVTATVTSGGATYAAPPGRSERLSTGPRSTRAASNTTRSATAPSRSATAWC